MTGLPSLKVRATHRLHDRLTIDVTMTLRNEVGVVFGPSGAGKSTLLRLIAGLARPDAGKIALGDVVLFDSASGIDLPMRRRGIGMIFQDDLLFPHLNVRANIAFGLSGRPRAYRELRTAEVATLCGVERWLDRRPETLSGGERQRVGLARALAPRPRLLLCDEPVSALDLTNRRRILDRLRAIQHVEQIPVLYVTHSADEAVSLGTTLYYLEAGEFVASGPPLDVLSARLPAFSRLETIRNVFRGRVVEQARCEGTTRVRLDGGPDLIVPWIDLPLDAEATVEVDAQDVLLAREAVDGLSARNQIPGTIERIVPHGSEAEVLVRTGELRWLVSMIDPTTGRGPLSLEPGGRVYLIAKARSCRTMPS